MQSAKVNNGCVFQFITLFICKMMRLKYNRNMRRKITLTESDLHRIVKETVNRVLVEARKNRPLKDYADEITQKWRGAKHGTIERDNLWDKYKELDRMERVHALRNGEYPTASYHGQTYTIDDPLPNATIYIHLSGAPYAYNAYPNEGESIRDYVERNGVSMEDITDWWFDD